MSSVFICLTGANGEIWINAERILYMKHTDGETAIFFEGNSVAIYVRETPELIARMIDAERSI